jgi:hypothetical protein
MSRSIYWHEISPEAKVRLVGKPGLRTYRVGRKTVTWFGEDAVTAQRYLDERIRRSQTKPKGRHLK